MGPKHPTCVCPYDIPVPEGISVPAFVQDCLEQPCSEQGSSWTAALRDDPVPHSLTDVAPRVSAIKCTFHQKRTLCIKWK